MFDLEVKEYFDSIHNTYDETENKPVWMLCDKIIETFLLDVLQGLGQNAQILDAGCGTGNWTNLMFNHFPEYHYYACDNNVNMLNVAKNKNPTNNIMYSEMDLEKMTYDNEFFDVIVCIYVFPFVKDFKVVIKELNRTLKKGGKIILVCQNYFESLALSIICNGIKEAESIEQKHSSKIANRPTMCFETYKEIEDILKENAFFVEDAFSFPMLSYIGLREKITGNSYSISDVLKIDNNFDKILELEKRNINNFKSKDRGLYIFVYARKE